MYPYYIAKAEKKGRTKAEVDKIICWLTGYTQKQFEKHLEKGTSFEDFYTQPKMNPKRSLIKGVVCGVRIEGIDERVMREIRYLDKLIDELAKGKKNGRHLTEVSCFWYTAIMEKISQNKPENKDTGNIYESLGLSKYVLEMRGRVRKRLRAQGKSEEEITLLTQTPEENTANPSIIISQVIPEDIDDLIASFEKNKSDQLKEFSAKGEGFNPETGNFVNDDTSWWDNQILELQNIQAKAKQ